MTLYHSTHTATPAGNSGKKECCKVANAYDQLNWFEHMIEIATKDSCDGAQWMAKRKTLVDQITQRKAIYSTSIRDQVINISTTETTAGGNVPEVVVTNPSESGSEREKLQRRLDALRSTSQKPGEELFELTNSLRTPGQEPRNVTPSITKRRSKKRTSNSSRRNTNIMTNPNVSQLGNIDSSGMNNLRRNGNNLRATGEGQGLMTMSIKEISLLTIQRLQ
jgi:hypothetical protein